MREDDDRYSDREYTEYLIADYVEREVDGVTYGFHYNIRWETEKDDEFDGLKRIEGEISAELDKPHYKTVRYAVQILDNFL